MKLTIEVDQSKWRETESEVLVDGMLVDIYEHEEYIYRILYDWEHGFYSIIRPCDRLVCCVQDMIIAQTIVELIATNQS